MAETIAALRAELIEAMNQSAGAEVQFPVGQVQLEFQVGVTRQGDGSAGVKFWVLEFGAKGSYASEQVQRVTVTLEPPIGRDGLTVKVLTQETEGPS